MFLDYFSLFALLLVFFGFGYVVADRDKFFGDDDDDEDRKSK